ncbi:hypothetical protein ILUMI_20150, partial [Ignelater luminosus]
SDNCSVQNKNKYLKSMYMYIVKNFDIEKITHKCLIAGHTENKGNSMHSCIEKEKNRILKKNPIYGPSEIYGVAKLAKPTENPYTVIEVSTEVFLVWKKVCDTMGKNFVIN